MSIVFLGICYLVGIIAMLEIPSVWYGGLIPIVSGTVLFFNLRHNEKRKLGIDKQ